jgi:hypothetical protein
VGLGIVTIRIPRTVPLAFWTGARDPHGAHPKQQVRQQFPLLDQPTLLGWPLAAGRRATHYQPGRKSSMQAKKQGQHGGPGRQPISRAAASWDIPIPSIVVLARVYFPASPFFFSLQSVVAAVQAFFYRIFFTSRSQPRVDTLAPKRESIVPAAGCVVLILSATTINTPASPSLRPTFLTSPLLSLPTESTA